MHVWFAKSFITPNNFSCHTQPLLGVIHAVEAILDYDIPVYYCHARTSFNPHRCSVAPVCVLRCCGGVVVVVDAIFYGVTVEG